jgi:hypothetical protein
LVKLFNKRANCRYKTLVFVHLSVGLLVTAIIRPNPQSQATLTPTHPHHTLR